MQPVCFKISLILYLFGVKRFFVTPTMLPNTLLQSRLPLRINWNRDFERNGYEEGRGNIHWHSTTFRNELTRLSNIEKAEARDRKMAGLTLICRRRVWFHPEISHISLWMLFSSNVYHSKTFAIEEIGDNQNGDVNVTKNLQPGISSIAQSKNGFSASSTWF